MIMERWKFPLRPRRRGAVSSRHCPVPRRDAPDGRRVPSPTNWRGWCGFGGDRSGIVLETEAFRSLHTISPFIANVDVFKFLCDLETVDEEIVEMEKILTT